MWKNVCKSWTGKWHQLSSFSAARTSVEERIIYCNQPDRNISSGYADNCTWTTKYTWYSFLPKSLYEQYRRAAYWYFTAMAALSLTPFSPYTPVSVIVPLLFVLSLGMAREIWEDLRRARGDKEVNSRQISVYSGGKEERKLWKDIHVGDIVKVEGGNYFPADLLFLFSSTPDGICYVETKNLDGETNLKVRQALECTMCLTEDDLKNAQWIVKSEVPNASLYTYTGLLQCPDGHSFPLSPPQLLLRESSLQNTGYVFGVVIFAGHDTKVMQNATPPPSKRSRIDKALDTIMWFMFGILFSLSFVTGIISAIFTRNRVPDMYYLRPYENNPYFNPRRAAVAGIVSFITGVVLYGYLIPISLYVTLEIVRILQALFMGQDLHMYDSETDRPAKVKSSGLNEELGQVDTILSDKTGTLTCNQMDFCRCTIGGTSYGVGQTEVEIAAHRLGMSLGKVHANEKPLEEYQQQADGKQAVDEASDNISTQNRPKVKSFNFFDTRLLGGNWMKKDDAATIRIFFQILSLCHTAIPEGSPDDPSCVQYRAESPDETALVIAAQQFGFFFNKRTPSTLHVKEANFEGLEIDRTYQLLDVLEFSSTRKRMSVIVRFPQGKLMLLSKGADSVMFRRLGSSNTETVMSSTLQHLRLFGEAGLRTLLFAYKELHEEEYELWKTKNIEAQSTIGKEREKKIEEIADEIETDLTLVGGTGVEDKLQEGVPECIAHLASAGIKVWVLTGDKVETAINIGYACSLLRPEMEKIIVTLQDSYVQQSAKRMNGDGLGREEHLKDPDERVKEQLSEGLQSMEVSTHENQIVSEGLELMPWHKAQELKSSSKNLERLTHSDSSRGPNSKSSSGKFSDIITNAQVEENKQSVAGRGPTSKNSSGKFSDLITKSQVEEDKQSIAGLGMNLVNGVSSNNLQNGGSKKSFESEAGGKHLRASIAQEFALVIDGDSLAVVLADDKLQELFLNLSKRCASVLCCRVSPKQKARVTKLVKKGLGEDKLCLAIGDGANDVGMIQVANVGVGIAGVEGAQAAMAADYAIGKFRFLERLLLVHGHWSYRRISILILYFLYKVSLMGWIAFYSNIFSFFSGLPLYNDWYASFYSTVFTALPVGVLGTLDQDVTASECLRFPQLYRAGKERELFNKEQIIYALANSLYASLVIFFFPVALYLLEAFRPGGQVASLQDFGAALFTGLVLVPNLQVLTIVQYFTWIHHLTIWGSIISWYVFLMVYGAFPPRLATVAYKEFLEALAPSASYWLLQLIVVAGALLPDFLLRSIRWYCWPYDYQLIMETSTNQDIRHQEPESH
ncbi:hypothetical protein O6H91_04G114100 [Diphasiastrum complanatum]|uniref:Uncharacterized protein n=1 Tax=Diphasiastrum complanatum TaxID=34168 RepID=A0ACC2E0H9_DIPCM|nr:hypothetical protein O6H91_04G114100 [Diphasiastrum complanatum]